MCYFQMLCSSQVRYSCQNLCGNALDCGNHYCTKSCHALKPSLSSAAMNLGGAPPGEAPPGLTEPCEQCRLPCQKVSFFSFDSLLILFSLSSQERTGFSHVFCGLMFFNLCLGAKPRMPTSMPSAMPPQRLSSLQSAGQKIVPLRLPGSCF